MKKSPTETYLKQELLAVIWDVQHGNATYIKTPNGKNIIIDLGRGSYTARNEKFSPIKHIARKYKVKEANLVVVTHPHFDHIEDINSLKGINVKKFITPAHIPRLHLLTKARKRDRPIFREYLNHRSTTKIPSRSIMIDGVKFHFFIHIPNNLSNLNNHSIVTVVEYENHKLIIPGDNEESSLKELMKSIRFRNTIKNANYLIAPHHGRKAGYYKPFVGLANPEITIISDGRKLGTSARHLYSAMSRGKYVLNKKGEPSLQPKKTLVTSLNGVVTIRMGRNSKNLPADRIKLSGL